MKMHTLNYLRRTAALGGLVLATIAAAACGLDNNAMPALSGPSGFGRSVVMTASPDQLPRDATSLSTVTLELRDASGLRIGGQIVTLGVSPGAALSQSQVTTGPDGKATFAVVAPSSTAIMPNNSIVVTAVPVGGNSDNAVAGSLSIALLGTSNTTAPAPAFTVTPLAPEINKLATFDATPTTDEGGQCLSSCIYEWDFDDGVTAAGRIVTHAFSVSRSYNVALTVTDPSGLVVTVRQSVTPFAPASPTVVLAVAPSPPILNQQAIFTATATPAPNHQVVRYEWDFGDGTNDTTVGRTVTKTYSSPGTVAVTVRATDDVGQVGAASTSFTIASGITAAYFFTPTVVHVGATTYFNASGSTPSNGATIKEYQWNWGDGSSGTTSDPLATHTFGSANTFVVKLTVVDSQNRNGVNQQNVAVVP